MPFDLARLARQQGRRRNITLRPIIPTQAMASDLAAIYAPAWRVWQGAADSILAGYDPAPLTGDGTTISATTIEAPNLIVDSPAQIEASLATTAAEFLRLLVTEITPGLRRWAVRAETWHRDKWIAAVKAGTGIDLSTILTVLGTEDTLEVFVARNVALAKNVSDQAQQRIADAVWRGYQNRTPSREVAKEIAEATGMARDRSRRIAADQNVKLASALDMERQAEAGLEQYRWRHSGKLHPRLYHLERNGDLFKLGEPKEDTPGQAPYCGCRAQAYIPLMDENA